MKKLLLLMLLVGCASCKKPLRSADICLIDVTTSKANCSHLDERYVLEYPKAMMGWSAFKETSMLLLSSRLEQCERDGKLPHEDNTWYEMDVCVLDDRSCGRLGYSQLDGYFALDPLTVAKVQQKLEFCRR